MCVRKTNFGSFLTIFFLNVQNLICLIQQINGHEIKFLLIQYLEISVQGWFRLTNNRVCIFVHTGASSQAGATQLASVLGSNMITASQASGLANSLAATANINQLLPSKYPHCLFAHLYVNT